MDAEHLLTYIIIVVTFVTGIVLVKKLSEKINFPYTVGLLLIGIILSIFAKDIELLNEITLSHNVVFLIILPLLLFEAAMHINFHQFRLQFKTITFLATFGLMVSIFAVGFILSYLAGLPLDVSILFGAIISATDPIAVISLFKSLGAPKRLTLIADGESMFNDATAVIAFKIISAFVVTGGVFSTTKVFEGAWSFIYIFIGSIVLGFILGVIVSEFIARVDNDMIVETTLTAVLAIVAFIIGEDVFHFSGVITTVIAGITVGNYGKTKISRKVVTFINEFWEYVGFICLSIVFLFAGFYIKPEIFTQNINVYIVAIISVLVARSLSVYLSAFFTNRLRFFKDEPSIPTSWQHILNWGGLRGVIPLVLVFTLPEEYEHNELLLSLTLAVFVFTVIFNGITIKPLIIKLGIHLPKKDEELIKLQRKLFNLEQRRSELENLAEVEFDKDMKDQYIMEIEDNLVKIKDIIKGFTDKDIFRKSLQLEALNIERSVIDELYDQNRINENIYFKYESDLDLAEDAIEYPEIDCTVEIKEDIIIRKTKHFRERMRLNILRVKRLPFLGLLFKETEENIVSDRYTLLRTRIIAEDRVLGYLRHMSDIISDNQILKQEIEKVEKLYSNLRKKNTDNADKLSNEYKELHKLFQEKLLANLVNA